MLQPVAPLAPPEAGRAGRSVPSSSWAFSSAASHGKLWKQLQKPVQGWQCWVSATGVGSQSHLSAPSSPISKFNYFFLKLLILSKTVMKPPDFLSWSFWETSKEGKTPGCQTPGLKASRVPRPGAACGNERHFQGLVEVKAPLKARGLLSPPEDAPTAPPDVGLQGAGWGGAAGGGGGIAAGSEREPPDRWDCPTFHEWLPLICFLHPPPAHLPAARGSHCQGRGRQGPVGTQAEGHSAMEAIRCPRSLAGLLGTHQPMARDIAPSYILNAPCTSGTAQSPALGCSCPLPSPH